MKDPLWLLDEEDLIHVYASNAWRSAIQTVHVAESLKRKRWVTTPSLYTFAVLSIIFADKLLSGFHREEVDKSVQRCHF